MANIDRQVTLVPQVFVDRVTDAGCTPVLLPPFPGNGHAVRRIDGLLLLAGPDVDPALYSAVPHPETAKVNTQRDLAEMEFLGAAIRDSVPFLGVCRGMQLLNTLCGGTLHQHLPEIVGHVGHSPGPGIYGPQRLRLEPGSRTATIMDCDAPVVSCHHHQAIDQVGTGLAVTAWAEDGTIEAVEMPDHPYAVAVQWHAEESADTSLFEGLAEAAQGRAAAHKPVRHMTGV